MAFYCAVHKDENQDELIGQLLDFDTEHMVKYRTYDLSAYHWPANYVLWEMRRDGKFYRFSHVIG